MDKIRELIGPGGKMIRSIVEEPGVKIDVADDGTVKSGCTDRSSSPAYHPTFRFSLAASVSCKSDLM